MTSTDKYSIYMGFSFSLDKDSTPGGYNQDIAQCIFDSWNAEFATGKCVWVGVQWEIYDALVKRWPNFVKSHVPLTHVAAPFLFRKEELSEERVALLRDLLQCTGLQGAKKTAMELLRDNIAGMLRCLPPRPKRPEEQNDQIRGIRYPDQLAAHLNRVILSGNFLEQLLRSGLNQMPMLHETKRGGWKEERILPRAGVPLGLFQSRRLSRIIIDWLFSDQTGGTLKAAYLNTVQVCGQLLDRVEVEGVLIDDVKVFGFPEHSPRCAVAACQTLWLRGILADMTGKATGEAIPVVDVNNPDGQVDRVDGPTTIERASGFGTFSWKWYPETAQEWCRSLEAWQRHEGRRR